MCVDQLLLFMNFWFGVILCIHYVSCVCHYGIPTICILSCFHMCLLTQSLSLSLYPPLLSFTLYYWVYSFIHSFVWWRGCDIYTFYVLLLRFVSWKVSICHRERWSESEWDQVVFAYVLAIGGVPWLSLSPCRAVFSWSVLGILLQRILYISVLLLFILLVDASWCENVWGGESVFL